MCRRYDVHAGPEFPDVGDRGLTFIGISAPDAKSAIKLAREGYRAGGFQDYPGEKLEWTAYPA